MKEWDYFETKAELFRRHKWLIDRCIARTPNIDRATHEIYTVLHRAGTHHTQAGVYFTKRGIKAALKGYKPKNE